MDHAKFTIDAAAFFLPHFVQAGEQLFNLGQHRGLDLLISR